MGFFLNCSKETGIGEGVFLMAVIILGMGVVVVVCIRLVVGQESKRIAKIQPMGYLAQIKTKTKLH